VAHGQVTLRGRLNDERDRVAVEQAITSIHGVAGVDNQIELAAAAGSIISLQKGLLPGQRTLAPARAA
jgi:osmotically-inducible protein OsmY